MNGRGLNPEGVVVFEGEAEENVGLRGGLEEVFEVDAKAEEVEEKEEGAEEERGGLKVLAGAEEEGEVMGVYFLNEVIPFLVIWPLS